MLSKLINQAPRMRAGFVASLALMGLGVSGVAHALTPAGTQIQSQTTGTFTDDLGNSFTTQSNIAMMVVQQVYSAYHQGDAHKFVQAGAEVSFPFSVTNSGNGEDTYTVSLNNQWSSINSDTENFVTLEYYLDTNNNGLADAGEPAASSFTLAGGETQNLVFVGGVPIAAAGNTMGLNIRVSAANGDVTDSNGTVGILNRAGDDVNANDYVNFMATITDNAILELSQVALADHANDQITFTTTVTNVGGREARDVVIFNGTPYTRDAFRDAMIEVSQSASGFGSAIDPADTDLVLRDGANGDSALVLRESVLGDMNGDGDSTDDRYTNLGMDLSGLQTQFVPGIWGVDDTLAAGASVSISFTVQYVEGLTDPDDVIPTIAAGTIINNTAFATGDLDGDGNRDPYHASNTTQTVIPQTYGAIINTDVPTSTPGVNDGGGDSNTSYNILTVSNQTITDLILFKHKVINTGNGTDAIEIAVADRSPIYPDHLPIETLQLFHEDGLTPLLNTNGIDGVDTGPMAPGEEKIIIVKARAQQGISNLDRFTYAVAANSAMDSAPRREPLDWDNDVVANWNAQTYNFSYGRADNLKPAVSGGISSGIDFSGFNPTPPATGPGSAAMPFTSLADAKTVLNKGRYVFDLGNGAFEADIDTAEGGGWVLVMQYIHQGGTEPAQNVINANADLPVTSNAALGDDESASATTWGHAGNAAIQQFFDAGTSDIETRWYGQTSNHNRVIHFHSTVGDDYMRSGSGNFNGIQNNFVSLTGHSANLPAAANFINASGNNNGNQAITNHAFFKGFPSGAVWIAGVANRWEVDDYHIEDGTTGSGQDTHHRVWIRDTAAPVAVAPAAGVSTYAEGDPGDTVSLPVVIRNNGSISESYSLAAGKSYIGGTLGAMHDGWSAVFKDGSGTPLVSTSLVPPGGEWTGTMEVNLPDDASKAYWRYNYGSATIIDDAGTGAIDPNSNGQADYPIFVELTGNNTGTKSVILNAVDVNITIYYELSSSISAQIRPGGRYEFSHVLTSESIKTHDGSIGYVNLTSSQPGWTTEVFLDPDGDGVFDTPWNSLTPNSTISATDEFGNLKNIPVTSSGHIRATGYKIPIVIRTFAPSNAPDGQVNTIELTLDRLQRDYEVSVTNTVTVSTAQLDLVKTASVNAACADASLPDLGPDTSFAENGSLAAPADCVIWQIVATNIGTDTLDDVVIYDAVPPFSTFKAGSLRMCLGNAGTSSSAQCTFTPVTDAVGDDEADFNAEQITFTLGQGASPVLGGSANLSGGESLTVRFATVVD